MKLSHIIYCFVFCICLSACDYSKDKMRKSIVKMRSHPISLSLEKMECLSNDSLIDNAPWTYAKFKLVHYVDSVQCTSCYLQKIKKQHNDLLLIEKEFNNNFYNIFIVDPRSNKSSLIKLREEYENNETPSTIFIDTAHVFIDINTNIPNEIMYHTFLLDKNDNVILVGNPMVNPEIKRKIYSMIEDGIKNNSYTLK